MFLKIHLFRIDGGKRGAGRGGSAGPVYFNNNSQTQGLSSWTLNETLGLRWSDKTQMLKKEDCWNGPLTLALLVFMEQMNVVNTGKNGI